VSFASNSGRDGSAQLSDGQPLHEATLERPRDASNAPGSTRLASGVVVRKNSVYIEALGAIDELSCSLGVLVAKVPDRVAREIVLGIQTDLYRIGRELSEPGRAFLPKSSVEFLQKHIDLVGAILTPANAAIIPGGCEAAALCYFAGAVCRSAERELVALEDIDPLPTSFRLTYLNRLSTFLSFLARSLNKEANVRDSHPRS
jgi:cob(I)alamin adenosyltransferase